MILVPIESNIVQLLKEDDNSGVRCILEERDRVIDVFEEFVTIGFNGEGKDENEMKLAANLPPDKLPQVIAELIIMFKSTYETMYKEAYDFNKDYAVEDLVEAIVKEVIERK